MNISERLKSYEPLWENWYLDDYISSGASGAVYKFKQNRFGTIVYSAVKVISVGVEHTLIPKMKKAYINELHKRAESEIMNMYLLKDCPYIVHCNNHAIKDVYDSKGNMISFDILIQMDLHTCLTSYLAENDSLSVNDVLKLADNIGSALKYAHNIDIMHRDIKPSNIFIDDNGNYLLGDLGVSKHLETDSFLTRTGTEPYIAPEIWNSDGTVIYTKSADIYSFGILLYTLLNDNYLPMVSEHSSASEISLSIIKRITGSTFEPPKYGSSKLKELVMSACEYNPKQRIDITSFLTNLNEIISDCNNNIIQEEKFIHKDNNGSWTISHDGMLKIYNFGNCNYKQYVQDIVHIVIADGTQIIPQKAFEGFSILSVSFPKSLIRIETEAFWGCSMLSSLDFNNCNVNEIGNGAFEKCVLLENLTFTHFYSPFFYSVYHKK